MTALDAAGLRHLLTTADRPRVVDVRTPGEFDSAHVPGSCNVPLDLLRAHPDQLRPHLGADVVLVCRSGQRATAAGQVLAAAGLPGLRVLQGGLIAWQDAGAPVATGRARWELERQVRLVAGSIVLGAVAASTVRPRLKWVAAVIGAGLTTAALTDTCLMGTLLAKLPHNRGPRVDLDGAVAALGGARR